MHYFGFWSLEWEHFTSTRRDVTTCQLDQEKALDFKAGSDTEETLNVCIYTYDGPHKHRACYTHQKQKRDQGEN